LGRRGILRVSRGGGYATLGGLQKSHLELDDPAATQALLGASSANLKLIEKETGAAVHARGGELTLTGDSDQVQLARDLLGQLYARARRGARVSGEEVVRAARVLRADRTAILKDIFSDPVLIGGRSRPIPPKGLAQKRYVDSIRRNDVVFGIGPAGTGQTYPAMAPAVPLPPVQPP